ncbi:hypothetical protein [Falsiroseomonas sp. E2-1-a20]|uniref:hypothetical protein n=1 Tax=Falsiroseomonas sp. E2-1-a20 TaxID=3239300 RepID=UPI003F3F1641
MNVGERFAWVRAVIAARPRPTLAQVAVAVTLAEHFNADRGAAWPAQQTIGDLIGRSRRTVRDALTGLEAGGLICRLSDGGPQSSARFALVMPTGGAPSRHQRAGRPAISGRPVPPSDGAPSRPEQVSRSDSVGKPYGAAYARSADASRTRGDPVKHKGRERRQTTPTTL